MTVTAVNERRTPMELIVMFGIVFLFGAVALSMVSQRHSPPPTPVFILRPDSLEKTASGSSGIEFLVLLLVIAGAIWLL